MSSFAATAQMLSRAMADEHQALGTRHQALGVKVGGRLKSEVSGLKFNVRPLFVKRYISIQQHRPAHN